MAEKIITKIQFKRGTDSPGTTLDVAEPGFDTQNNKVYVGKGVGQQPVELARKEDIPENVTLPEFKTINGQPIVGTGNIEIESGDLTLPEFKTVNGAPITGTGDIVDDLPFTETINDSSTNKQIPTARALNNALKNVKGNSFQEAQKFITRYQHQLIKACGVETTENTVDIIMFAGQSNSSGRALLTDIATPNDVIVTVDTEKGMQYPNSGSLTEILEPISANGSSGYGYIPAFINAYYETTKTKVIATYMSSGGTMLNKFVKFALDNETGQPTSTENTFYTNMVSRVNTAKTLAENSSLVVRKILFVWCQGESDGDYLGSSNAYANNYEATLTTAQQKKEYYREQFKGLVNDLKEDINLNQAFIIRIGHKSQNYTTYQPIIEAQNDLGKEEDITLVSCVFAGAKTFPEEDGSVRNLMRDSWHFKPEGYLRAGLEAGINAGISVNSNFRAKPILLDYNKLVVEDTREYERGIDKYLYNPNLIDLTFIKQFTTSEVSLITVNPSTVSIGIGQTTQLTFTHYPSTAETPNVIWESSNPSIATVNSTGLVTAIEEGTVTISAHVEGNSIINSSSTITVTSIVVPVTDISISVATENLSVGDTLQLTAVISPENATNKSVIWSSSDTGKATVNSNGLVTGIGAGTATITATSASDASKTATCVLTLTTEIVNTTLFEFDFINNTISDYITSGDVSLPNGNEVLANCIYDPIKGLCPNSALPNGLKLPEPVEIPDMWTFEVECALGPYEYIAANNAGIISKAFISGDDQSDTAYKSTSLAPCILSQYSAPQVIEDINHYQAQLRFDPYEGTSTQVNGIFKFDGEVHNYKFVMEASFVLKIYRDNILVETKSVTTNSVGQWGYILGTQAFYSYANSYRWNGNINYISYMKMTANSSPS